MPANIIETNSEPFKKVDVDAVTVDIIENALKNVRIEMDAVLFRTAMSPGIREQGDCFPMVANRDGKMVVGQFGSFIYGFMEAYEGDIEEGDIILTKSDVAPILVRAERFETSKISEKQQIELAKINLRLKILE